LDKAWQKEIENIYRKLNTSKKGLTSNEAHSRLLKYGLNIITKISPIPYLRMIYDQFADLLVLILVVAGFLSLALGDFRNTTVIFAIVAINAIIGFSQEFKTQRELAALRRILPSYAKVIRDGEERKILSRFLVPGDIIVLQEGDEVPADARLIEAFGFSTIESSLTGESLPKKKKAQIIEEPNPDLDAMINLVFAGTSVASGEGLALVLATGFATNLGKIASKTGEIKKAISPLQEKTRHIGKIIGLMAAAVVIFLFVYRYYTGTSLSESFIFAIAVAAAVVPEGLPATVSVALAIGARRLLQKNALIKRLSSVETLGSTTVICTDKTGTLTLGKMEIAEIFYLSQEEKEKLILVAALCNNAVISREVKLGDATELALLNWLEKEKINWQDLRKKYPKVDEIPFSSAKKFMQTINEINGQKIKLEKGAPEVLAERYDLQGEEKDKVEYKIKDFAEHGFRTLAFGYDQKFLAIVGISDPIRPEVPEAVKICHSAKIKLMMITGDNPLTAQVVAQKIGMGERIRVVEASELRAMDDIKLRSILLDNSVFARISPLDKYRIVENLKKMGEIVAVTGDGVNDAPALKRADIGVAMGKVGTDVAREAADLVLLDDNFSTIVEAVTEGRVIFDNIKKFVFYVFAHNFGELTPVLLGIFLKLPLPITAIQILAVDLGTDVLPSMSLIGEPPDEKITSSGPRDRKFPLMSPGILIHLALLGAVMGGMAIVNFWLTTKFGGSYIQATTATYATLVFCQFANLQEVRGGRNSLFKLNFWANPWVWWATTSSIVLFLAFLYLPTLQYFLGTKPMMGISWLVIGIAIVVFIMAEELYKIFWREEKS